MAGYDNIFGYGTRNAANALGIGSPIDFGLNQNPLDVSGMVDNSLVQVPTIPSFDTGGLFGTGIGVQDAQLALSGLGTAFGIYQGLQAQKLANKQYNLTRNMANANLTNSIQSYNTTLADRLNSRGKVEGTSAEETAAAIAANSLQNRNL